MKYSCFIESINNCSLFYRYKRDSSQVVGGRSRVCLVDLGLGERTSKGDVQAMTMPAITNLLVALFQGQRYLPSRYHLYFVAHSEEYGPFKRHMRHFSWL